MHKSAQRLAVQRSERRRADATTLRRCSCGDQIRCNGFMTAISTELNRLPEALEKASRERLLVLSFGEPRAQFGQFAHGLFSRHSTISNHISETIGLAAKLALIRCSARAACRSVVFVCHGLVRRTVWRSAAARKRRLLQRLYDVWSALYGRHQAA
jgi:hypothetical protein